MINKNLPEPEHKECGVCGRTGPKAHLTGKLIHVPDENCTLEEVTTTNGYLTLEPFSFWFYRCKWCRATYTRQENKYKKLEEEYKKIEQERSLNIKENV